ncbi:hypothetical protein J4421_06365 [Candidatus Woesearchaeota archaeon]|nr:hypothetical protein [Candidatus Woesearchaeota archaeon]HLC71640.1 hypothetical protein [Candidatus Nanoarchaeia archaeon]
MGLYSKLRQIGHGRLESLRRAIGYRVQNTMPFPSHEPIELQIEEHLSSLEDLVKPKYRPQGTELSEPIKREQIDHLVGYLDSQLRWDDKKRFSAAQIKRYEILLERLAGIYSEE